MGFFGTLLIIRPHFFGSRRVFFFRVLLFEPTVVKNCRELRPNNIGKVPFSWATILVGFKGIQVEGEMNIATAGIFR